MANTLMFEVGIKEADNQLTELEKRLKNMRKYKSGTHRAVKTNRYLINKAKKNIQGIKEHYNND